mgnify:CR=1 FL=1
MVRYKIYVVILCSGAFVHFCFGERPLSPVTSPPAALNLDPFYAKYLDCGGISVIGSDNVSDEAFYRLKALLDKMLENRPDVRQQLAEDGNRFIIIGRNEQVTDVPDYAHMEPKAFWNERARGFGGRTTSVGEENLLSLPEDRYEDESIFIHELAHSIHFVLRRLEPDFQATLDRLYQNAMDKGLYQHDYASTNASEYWAEAVQGFFDANRANNWNHNHISTREQLAEYDPDIVELVRKTFRITPENDWRYEPLAVQPSVHPTPDRFAEARTLPKYVWCRGFSIFGTADVSDEAMLCVDQTIRNLFRYRHDILKTLIDADVAVAVYADDELPSDVPVHKTLPVASFLRHDEPETAVGLSTSLRLGVAQSEIMNADGGNPLIGRMALAAYLYAGLRPIDPTFDQRRQKQQYEIGLERMDIRFDRRVQALYKAALQKGLWASTPATDNRFDYFAQGVQAFFDANRVADAEGREVNAREQLLQYDPELATLVGDLFKHPERYDWRHTPCSPIADP